MTLMKTAWAVAVATTLAATSLSAHADKKEVVQKILSSQQGALDDMARNMTEQPARQLAMGQTQQDHGAVPCQKTSVMPPPSWSTPRLKKYLDDDCARRAYASINKLAS
jgi:hypothetical protein